MDISKMSQPHFPSRYSVIGISFSSDKLLYFCFALYDLLTRLRVSGRWLLVSTRLPSAMSYFRPERSTELTPRSQVEGWPNGARRRLAAGSRIVRRASIV
jgi:hypothetical protein